MPKERDEKAFIDLALSRWKQADEAESDNRKDSLDDLRFSIGDQWNPMIKSQRSLDGRPCLTMDQTQQATRQVCNEQRQQRPAIQVNPVGDGADTDDAEIWQGIVRHIEVQSDAELAYDGSFESMVRCGRGHFRAITKYDEDGNQDIFIELIRNTFTVYSDPSPKCKWKFIVEDLTKEEYQDQYGKSELAASLNTMTGTGSAPPDWMKEGGVRVAEYYYIVETPREKKAPKIEVKWAKINAIEILEEAEIPGEVIPVFEVNGDDIDVDGKRYLAGLIRNAKDAQRQYNYMASAATESIALAPKAPFIVAEGQLENNEKQWKEANIRNNPFLQYKPIAIGGTPVGPPARQGAEPPIQAMSAMMSVAKEDLKAALGLYDPSLGQRKGDESGKAIERLQKQGDVATFNFSDNLSRTMRQLGRLLLKWIPVYYDTPRIQRIIKPDGTIKQVITHNGPDQAKAAAALNPDIKEIYDLSQGTFDVTINVGPSYQTRRQEAVATQMALIQAEPQLLNIIGDLVVGEMDIPGAKEIAKRLHAMLPTQVLEADDPTKQGQQLQAQVQQLGTQLQQATGLLNQAHQIIQTKQVEQQAKKDITQMQEQSRQAIVRMQEATKLAVAQINASKDANQAYADRELEQYQILHDAAHEVALTGVEQQHQKQMADQAAQNAQQSQAADQGHDAGMAAMQQAAQAEQPQNGAGA